LFAVLGEHFIDLTNQDFGLIVRAPRGEATGIAETAALDSVENLRNLSGSMGRHAAWYQKNKKKQRRVQKARVRWSFSICSGVRLANPVATCRQ
jgi:hypothetical protein